MAIVHQWGNRNAC